MFRLCYVFNPSICYLFAKRIMDSVANDGDFDVVGLYDYDKNII